MDRKVINDNLFALCFVIFISAITGVFSSTFVLRQMLGTDMSVDGSYLLSYSINRKDVRVDPNGGIHASLTLNVKEKKD